MKSPRRLGVLFPAVAISVVAILCCGCELLGEAGPAALEGGEALGAESAGAAARGTALRAAAEGAELAPRVVAAAGRTTAVAADIAADSLPRIARVYESEGAADALLEAAKRSVGSEPEVGWAEHFDVDKTYKGYSEFTRDEVRHFDDQGNFTGREVRSSSGSQVYDRDLRPSGNTEVRSGRTAAYDARGMYKGYSERTGNLIRGFDQDNAYTGFSRTFEWPKGYSAAPLAALTAAPFKRKTDVTVTGLHFFVGSHPATGCQAQFIDTVPFTAGRPVYLQIDSRIPQVATASTNIPFDLVIEEEGSQPFSVHMDQTVKAGWATACSWKPAFSLTADDAGRVMLVRLQYGGRELATAALKVTR